MHYMNVMIYCQPITNMMHALYECDDQWIISREMIECMFRKGILTEKCSPKEDNY